MDQSGLVDASSSSIGTILDRVLYGEMGAFPAAATSVPDAEAPE
jgi:hypothetical protein